MPRKNNPHSLLYSDKPLKFFTFHMDNSKIAVENLSNCVEKQNNMSKQRGKQNIGEAKSNI